MGDIKTEKKEEIIDLVEELIVLGFGKPFQVVKALAQRSPAILIDQRTAKKYINIAHRRTRNRYGKVEIDKVRSNMLRDLDHMASNLMIEYRNSTANKSAIANSWLKCMERRAKLLGMDIIHFAVDDKKTLEDFLKEVNEKRNKQQGDNRGIIQNPKQAGDPSSIPIQPGAGVLLGKEDEKKCSAEGPTEGDNESH